MCWGPVAPGIPIVKGDVPVADLVIAGVALVFSFVFWRFAAQIPQGRVSTTVGASFWPIMLLGLLALCAIFLLIPALHKRRLGNVDDGNEPVDPEEEAVGAVVYPHNFWVTLGLMGGYTYLMTVIGFVLATPVFIAFSSWIMGFRRWKTLVPVTIVLSLALIYLFPKVLYIPLPRGIGTFRTISLFFY